MLLLTITGGAHPHSDAATYAIGGAACVEWKGQRRDLGCAVSFSAARSRSLVQDTAMDFFRQWPSSKLFRECCARAPQIRDSRDCNHRRRVRPRHSGGEGRQLSARGRPQPQ